MISAAMAGLIAGAMTATTGWRGLRVGPIIVTVFVSLSLVYDLVVITFQSVIILKLTGQILVFDFLCHIPEIVNWSLNLNLEDFSACIRRHEEPFSKSPATDEMHQLVKVGAMDCNKRAVGNTVSNLNDKHR